MKTFTIHALTAIVLSGLTMATFAQNNMDAARQQMQLDLEKQFLRLDLLSGLNARLGVVQTITSIDSFQEALGLSQDQAIELKEHVLGGPRRVLENDPAYVSLRDEIGKLQPFSPDATKETLKQYTDLRMTMLEMHTQKTVEFIYETYTPDQMKKINEFLISSMSETEYVFPRMFEVLDLSDDQKKQLDAIQKEIEPEFEKHIANRAEYNLKHQARIREKLQAITDPEERRRLRNDQDWIRKTLAELQPERDKMMASGKKLANELKIRMFDVLTDAQWDRMIQLVDNPPEYVKKTITQTRKWREEIDNLNNSKTNAWVPGPNSWRPGDPIPEQYRQERNERRRFPKTEN